MNKKDTQDVNQVANMGLLTASQLREEKLTKKNYLLFKVILGLFIFTTVILFIDRGIQKKVHQRDLARQLAQLTEVKDGFQITDEMTDEERYFKYKKFMMRIIGAFGKTYDPKNPHALDPKYEQAEYIKFNWKASRLLQMHPYRVPSLHQLESCFDPWANNTNSGLNEKGIGQQCWSAALTAQMYLKFMSSRLRRHFDFELKSSDDLYDWETSTKITYILLYFHDREFKGRTEWSDSVYHWGNFLRRHWDDGNGELPETFTFVRRNGSRIQYSVISYWQAAERLKIAYEQGDLEYGRHVYLQYDVQRSKLLKDEIDLRNARRVLRKLENELRVERELKERALERRTNLENMISQAKDDLTRIYGEAARQKGIKAIKETLKKHKTVLGKVIRKMELDDLERERHIIQVWVCIGSCFIGFPLIILIILLWKRGRKK